MAEKKFKQVCECKNCGNEAEMEVTCTLEEVDVEKVQPKIAEAAPSDASEKDKVKGHAVCSHCGNEADMWVDI